MTEEVKPLDEQEIQKIAQLRAMMDYVITKLDLLEQWMKRGFVKDQVSKIRNQLTKPLASKASVDVLYAEWFGTGVIKDAFAMMEREDDHEFKPKMAKVVQDALTLIDRYVPDRRPPTDPNYGLYPLGHKKWVDEQGNNMFHSERKDAKLWLSQHKGLKEWQLRERA